MDLAVFLVGEWAASVADRFEEFLAGNDSARISLPTGTTPQPLYDELVDRNTDLSHVELFLLDEFGGIPADHPARCEAMLRRTLLDRLERPPRLNRFDVEAADAAAEAAAYETDLTARGGLDLVVLGLGTNGHVALNEPGAEPDSPTRVVQLADATISSAPRYGPASQQPTWGLTLGMRAILAAAEVWLIVTGREKRDILRRVIAARPSVECPATLLALNPNAIILADEAAAR